MSGKVLDFPVIDQKATGKNILRLRLEKRLTIQDVQEYFGFDEPAAIYRWQRGDNLPSLDNMVALSQLFGVTVEDILVLKETDNQSTKVRKPSDAKRGKRIRSLFFFLAS